MLLRYRLLFLTVLLAPLIAIGVEPTPTTKATTTDSGFTQTLSLQGITFEIRCTNSSALNKLTISPSGLSIDNSPVHQEIDGTVTGAEVADLNQDGSPEIYVYVTSAGSGAYSSVVGYGVNHLKSMTPIFLPELSENKQASAGYMGHDAFAVVESMLVRRFPVYKKDDTNSAPTGGTRQIQYKLKAGEAGWLLEADKIVDY